MKKAEPAQNSHLFVGPFTNAHLDENAPKLSCAPIFSKSEFCAPCHYAEFWDTTIYASYKEWKESAYAVTNSGSYKSCQDCHMRPGGRDAPSDPESKDLCNGSIDGTWISTHDMMGRESNGLSPSMVVNAASVKVDTSFDPKFGRINVEVVVTNDKVGHKFPTDSPLRHLILVVEAVDAQGNALPQVYGENGDNNAGKKIGERRQNGETIPVWIGEWWNPDQNFAGYPGKVFANILVDEISGSFPSVSYWNRTKPAWDGADTRLLPNYYDTDNDQVKSRPDRSFYYFSAPVNCDVTVTAKLWYRYAFLDLAAQKNWNKSDILVAEDVKKACSP